MLRKRLLVSLLALGALVAGCGASSSGDFNAPWRPVPLEGSSSNLPPVYVAPPGPTAEAPPPAEAPAAPAPVTRPPAVSADPPVAVPAPRQEAPTPQPPQPAPEPEPPAPQPVEPKPAPEPPKPAPEPAPAPEGLTADEALMLRLINEERVRSGLPAFEVDMRLVQTARVKSQDMITDNYFSHDSARLGSPFDQIKAAGIRYMTAGENIAGNPSVEGAHRSLMNSPGHRANILSQSFKRIGIGIMSGGRYGLMFTQQFIG